MDNSINSITKEFLMRVQDLYSTFLDCFLAETDEVYAICKFASDVDQAFVNFVVDLNILRKEVEKNGKSKQE